MAALLKTTCKQKGFTLVELIIVVVLAGIVAPFLASIVGKTVQGYVAVSRRADLVDAADAALRKMTRDIRTALPNSVRIADSDGNQGLLSCDTSSAARCALEFIHTVDGGRYRDGTPGTAVNILSFGIADKDFDVLGTLANFADIDPASDYIVIHNTNATDATSPYNAYTSGANRNRAQLSDYGATPTTATHISLQSANRFPGASESQRFYIVDEPIAYLCEPASQRITRFNGHAFSTTQSTSSAGFAGATAAAISNHISNCKFTYQAGSTQRSAVVSVEITLTYENENIRLLHQVNVPHTP